MGVLRSKSGMTPVDYIAAISDYFFVSCVLPEAACALAGKLTTNVGQWV
jgi:hypothetical protein